MYISELYATGFRCFGPDSPLALQLRPGLNILVGPNDSGKTAIIDVPRFVLWTRGDDFVRLEATDFHVKSDAQRVRSLLLRCTFDGLTSDEESRFLEWCSNDAGTLRLYVCLRATLRQLAGGGDSVVTQYRAGKEADGLPLDGDLREYLKSTYLRPLRDAERELRSGRRSRLSRILGALPDMAKQSLATEPGQAQTLIDTMKAADTAVESNDGVQGVQNAVNQTYLDDLSFPDDPLKATLSLGARGSFEQLLERLELYLNPPPGQTERLYRGLGYNNLLFMAAELLLLQSHPEQVPFLLIEEPEAHLHPQHQTLFMHLLEDRTAPVPEAGHGAHQRVQVLLTTHSAHLAASANLDAMIMVVGHRVYPLAHGCTKLTVGDYGFLRRFLDATKANLFFARGIIIVEGDAENILLPALARKIGKPLGKHGVSIVNVGHRGLFRYSRIFQRLDGSKVPVPVALIPDRDIPPDAAKELVGGRPTESGYTADEKATHLEKLESHTGEPVATFLSPQWTFEFDLARQDGCVTWVHQAIQMAKGKSGMTPEAIAAHASAEITELQAATNRMSDDEIATHVYKPLHSRLVSKAEAAEHMAALVDALPDTAAQFRARLPAYLVDAIDYVTGTSGQGGPLLGD